MHTRWGELAAAGSNGSRARRAIQPIMTTHDVFISYAHVDNEALLEDQDGWIAVLHRVLEKRLSQLLGRVANVWWDRRRLNGNVYFDDTIATACENTTVMVSVISPRYLKSDYCRKEVEHFSATRGVKIGDRSRIFSCIKTPVARDALFPQLAGKLGYEFYRGSKDEGYFREYDVYNPELKPLFMSALEELAQDVAKLVVALAVEPRSQAAPAPVSTPAPAAADEPAPKAPAVFVATTSGDAKPIREGVARELKARGALVTPEAAWSESLAGFDKELAQAAGEVSLSVHILGAGYGTIPEDAEASYPVLQLERIKQLAAQRSLHAPLARIVWIAREPAPTSEKQRKFLESVRNDPAVGALDELLEGSEEELKERIVAKLATLEKLAKEREAQAQRAAAPQPGRASGTPAVRKVYVISADTEAESCVVEVEQALGARGFDVISSLELAEEETEAAREARHQHWLAQCDGCLILHGHSKVSWVRAQIDEVRKAMGHRQIGPMFSQVVYLAPPVEGLKRRYQVYFPKLEWVEAPAVDLAPFVHDLLQEVPAPTLKPAASSGVR